MIRLIHGSDQFSSLNKAHKTFKSWRKKNPEAEIFNEDLESQSLSKFFDLVESTGLFSSEKLLLIKNISKNKKFTEATDRIIEKLKNIPEEVSILFWEDSKLRSNMKFVKFFKAEKREEVFEELKKNQVRKVTKELVEKHSLRLDSEALMELLMRANHDIGFITNEVKKLSLIGKDEIELEDIQQIVPDSNESLIWDLTDAITESDRKKALAVINNLITNESDEFIIIPMIGRQLRIMIQIKLLLEEGKDNYAIARAMKLPPFIIAKSVKYAKDTELDKLKRMFGKLVDMDFAIKTGRMEAEIALSLFCSLL